MVIHFHLFRSCSFIYIDFSCIFQGYLWELPAILFLQGQDLPLRGPVQDTKMGSVSGESNGDLLVISWWFNWEDHGKHTGNYGTNGGTPMEGMAPFVRWLSVLKNGDCPVEGWDEMSTLNPSTCGWYFSRPGPCAISSLCWCAPFTCWNSRMTYGWPMVSARFLKGEMSTSHYYQPSPGRNLLKDLNHENWYQLEG